MLTAILIGVVSAVGPASEGTMLAWQGCWHADGDASTAMLCIVPSSEGVRMVSLLNGQARSEETLVPDNVARAVSQEGCAGTRRARWSDDRRRIYVMSEMKCGDEVTRRVTGIMSMRAPDHWISVNAVTSGSQTITTVMHYREAGIGVPQEFKAQLSANKLARETARVAASEQLDLTDVSEAVKVVDAQAVENWLTAMNQEFDLDGRKLVALADAGVPSGVIDVLVAVSNPDAFAVRTVIRRDEDDYYRRRGRPGIGSCYDPWDDPWIGTMGYGYGYRRCGGYYPAWGRGGYGGYYGTPVIIVRGPVENSRAKVTRKGYTRGDSDRGVTSTRAPGSTDSPSPGSGSTARSGSGGRKAKPRGN